MSVVPQVLTLFVLMMIGLFAAKKRMMDDRAISALSTLVLSFAQPALIIARMQDEKDPSLLIDLVWVLVLSCVIMLITGTIARKIFAKQPEKRKAILSVCLMGSNCGFMGYPVIEAAFGPGAVIYAVMFVTSFNFMSWTLGAYYFAGRKAMDPKRLVTNPSLIAVVFGIILFLTGWRLPGFVNNALNSIGGTTTPLAMFVIGARLTGLNREHLKDRQVLLTCLLRLVVFPLCVLLILRLFGLPDMVVKSLYLCTAMPFATMVAMQSEVFHSDTALASRAIALSTALSLGTIPLMLLFV